MKPSRSLLYLALATLGFPGFAVAKPLFPQQVYDAQAPSGVAAIQVADLNKDGKPDLVTLSKTGVSSLQVLLGSVNGTFTDHGSAATISSNGYFTVADVNGDGIPDIVFVDTSNAESGGLLSVELGKGNGLFTAKTSELQVAPVFGATAFGDLLGNGKLDIVIADSTSPKLYVILGNGDASFQGTTTLTYSGSRLTTFVLADVNHDGKQDIVGTDGSNLIVMLGNGDGTFTTPVIYPGLSEAGALAVADINGDGFPDVVTTGENQYSIFINNGDGTFQTATTVGSYPRTINEGAIALADLDGDGFPELMLLDDNDNAVLVMHNKQDGSFAAPQLYVVGTEPQSIAVVDLNGDGHPDLMVGELQTVSILFNNGDGTFPGLTQVSNVGTSYLAIADVSGDGVDDIVSSAGDDTFKVQISNGDSTFQAAQSYSVVEPGEIVTADLNGDRHLDVIVESDGDAIEVWLNQGNGTFSLKTTLSVPSDPSNVTFAVADLNGDGKPDIVVQDGGSIYEFMGDGAGNFTAGNIITLKSGGYMAFADLNNDGRVDMVVAASTGVYIYLGNGDGTFQQPSKPYQAFGAAVFVAIADMNGDGIPDIVCGMPSQCMLIGKGDGTFTAVTEMADQASFTAFGFFNSMHLADVNGDGLLDVVGVAGSTVVLFIQNSDHLFTTETAYEGGAGAIDVGVGDVNRDGRPDLVVATNIIANGINLIEQTDEHAPTLSPLPLNLQGTATATGTLVGSDQDGDAIEYLIESQPAHGTASVNATTGALTYFSSTNTIGQSDSFTVVATDGTLNSTVMTVNVAGSAGGSGSGGKSGGGGGGFGSLEFLGLLPLAWAMRRRPRRFQG